MKKQILPIILSIASIVPSTMLPLTGCNKHGQLKKVMITTEVVGGHGTITTPALEITEFTPFANAVQMLGVKPDKGYKVDKWVGDDGKTIKDNFLIETNLHCKVYFTHCSFKEDSWASICEQADKGLENLKAIYGLETFIGQERTITLGANTYVVRVIGEQHDDIWDGTKVAGKAALTFESEMLYTDPDTKQSAKKVRWDTKNVKDYFNSCLQGNLNFSGSAPYDEEKKKYVLTKSIKEMISSFEPDLFSHIKTVYKDKYVYLGLSTREWDHAKYSTDIFSPSATELGVTGPIEGTTYEYWKNKEAKDRIKKDTKGNTLPYWTSTPNNLNWKVDPETSEKLYVYAVSIGGSGVVNESTDITNSEQNCCINFAFCI